ncbi:phage tail protein [Pectobacterium wasabiae]|uniref:Phage tail collar domain-containing protein n=1 Tax=Pectobacterium wasabiae TaxID=55208 RepID=A0AAW3EM90_9GAMM|nr:phage tail protein [Pectobacterium wasabiae]AOR64804.1 hypothetical protein A7983_16395 [Pectobacterium wasabiae CFBP 3304]EJS93861.1 Tail fiber [Pectobacterium wasabiae CFBP 3304]KFX09927.1 hypothetical protein JV38_03130 [Pectobacterium wasabiae]KGA30129.1 hypothetical protein KU73_06855 [Pectobacterium wasabiae]
MANLSENPQWVDGIYQIETSDPVVGGPDGVSNRQAKELASRTRYLKKEQEKTGSDLATHAAAADPHTQYAPKANPTFTGMPKAPTPATDSNSQQVATTAFVHSVGSMKLAKDQNGADIPDKTAFYGNVLLRGTLGDGMTFANCDKAGDYVVAISDPNKVSDMPTYKGQKLYGYGVLHVSQRYNFVGQEYTNHSGDYAWRQKWDDGVYAPWVVALSSSRVPTATDVGALSENATAQAAVKFATPRTINGIPFDGTANIALTPTNLGLTETVNLAAGALAKAKNGADILDKVAFISNLIERGHLSDGGTFSACNQPGIYRVGTENPASISDMPKNNNGEYLYCYGVLSVQRIAGVITQVYKNHFGQIATRQSWDDGKAYNNWNVPYDSAINKPTAADVGALSLNELVGIPMPWPQATAPSGWLKCNGQIFDQKIYPLLAQLYPSRVLPDLRGEFIRGWDDGRKIDSGRTILSLQLDLFKSHYHALQYIGFDNSNNVNGTSGSPLRYASGDDPGYLNYNIDSLVGGAETRPRNIAFNYIVRAA